jgi:hypothetical protein
MDTERMSLADTHAAYWEHGTLSARAYVLALERHGKLENRAAGYREWKREHQ